MQSAHGTTHTTTARAAGSLIPMLQAQCRTGRKLETEEARVTHTYGGSKFASSARHEVLLDLRGHSPWAAYSYQIPGRNRQTYEAPRAHSTLVGRNRVHSACQTGSLRSGGALDSHSLHVRVALRLPVCAFRRQDLRLCLGVGPCWQAGARTPPLLR